MKRKFMLKINLTFWIVVVLALILATIYQAAALNRDFARIPASLKLKIPSIIIIGGLAQIFILRISSGIKKLFKDFDEASQNTAQVRSTVIELQKRLSRLRLVFIIVNSVGFFLGPTVTFIIYHFKGSPYPPGEIFYIITVHVLTGTIASILQMSLVRIIFQDILSSFNIHENITELRGIDAWKKRFLSLISQIMLFLFLISGQIYGVYADLISGKLSVSNLSYSFLFALFVQSLIYALLMIAINFLLTLEEQNKFRKLQKSISDNIEATDNNFSKINIISYDDFGDLSESINAYTSRLESLHNNISIAGNTVSRTSGELENSIRQSEKALFAMQEINKDMVEEVKKEQEAMISASSAVDGISDSIRKVGDSVSSQAGIVEESSAAISEMSANIRSVASSAQKASEVTKSLSEMTLNGSSRLEETVRAISELKDASDRVQSIITVIQSISAQTNLLAMNAAIEAAHAGESGAGFSVVADEVRKLAEESSKSAQEIGNIIKEMTTAISHGVDSAGKTEESFGRITGSVSDTGRIIDQVSASMDEQQRAADEITIAMTDLVDVSLNLKDETKLQMELNKTMTHNVIELNNSIGQLMIRSEQLQEEDNQLSEQISNLQNVNDLNGDAVVSLTRAVQNQQTL